MPLPCRESHARRTLRVVGLPFLLLCGAGLGAQTLAASGSSGAPVFDDAAFLRELDVRLARAAADSSTDSPRLRGVGARLIEERVRGWQTRWLASVPPGRKADAAELTRRDTLRGDLMHRLEGVVRQRLAGFEGRTGVAQPLGSSHHTAADGPVMAGRGSMAGHVSPWWIGSTWVEVYTASGGYVGATPISSVNGAWSIGVDAGTYYVKTSNSSGLIDQAWPHQPCAFAWVNPRDDCGASPITILADGGVTGIDFALPRGGRVAGVVSAAATFVPLSAVRVDILDEQGRHRTAATTDATGLYTSDQGLPTGTYYATTDARQAGPAPGFLGEGYDSVPCQFGACSGALAPIEVTSPDTTEGVNFSLDPAGALSGTVTDASTGLPVSSALVAVFTATGSEIASGYSRADGSYVLGGLPAGSYKVAATRYSTSVGEVWSGHPCAAYLPADCDLGAADPIQVSTGATTGGVDFTLASVGSISGRVTRSDTGAGIGNVAVAAGRDSGSRVLIKSFANTDADGSYTVGGLPPGDYHVWTAAARGYGALNFVDQLLGGVPCVSCPYWGQLPDSLHGLGDTVAVSSGSTTPGVDFALDPGGRIAGTVTRAGTGVAVSGLADVYSAPALAKAASASIIGGAYVAIGLPTGRYLVEAHGWNGEVPRVFANVPVDRLALGTPIGVTAGATTAGINFALQVGGGITGRVTRGDSGGSSRYPSVSVYTASGRVIAGGGSTDTDGHYATQDGLPSGQYFVMATSQDGDLVPRLYKDVDCPAALGCDPALGAPVSVSASNIVTGIDFSLPVAGRVTGRVTDQATGLPIAGLSVRVAAVTSSGRWLEFPALTGLGGDFEARGLTAGVYYARVDAGGSGYVDEVYDDVPCAGCDIRTGRRVDVRAGLPTTGINFALSRGGAISGTVTKPGGVVDTTVEAYTDAGTLVRTSTVAADGSYRIDGLPAGSYRLLAVLLRPSYGVLYNGVACPNRACDVTTGTPVGVTAGAATTGVDFAMPATGSISGFVRDTAGNPAWGGSVFLFDGGMAPVLADGSYHLSGVPAGDHYLGTSVEGLVNEVYANIACAGCDPVTSGATPVTVMGGALTSGVDFALDGGGSIGGTVRFGGKGLGGARVQVRKAGSPASAQAVTSLDDGSYAVRGLPPGTYYATAEHDGYEVRLYNGLPCPGPCDPTSGTPITLVGSGAVNGIDFALAPESLSFYTLEPCRLLDTRSAAGALGGPALSCAGDRNFPVAGTCGVPFEARALSVNVTATGGTAQGHFRLHAGRTAAPTASSLNYTPGQTRANNAIVPLGILGEIGIYCGQGSGTAHAVVDVNGYFK